MDANPTPHITRSGVKCHLGQPIRSLDELHEACTKKVAVIVPNSSAWNIPRPAIFMMNQIGAVLQQCFKSGMFYYIKETKSK